MKKLCWRKILRSKGWKKHKRKGLIYYTHKKLKVELFHYYKGRHTNIVIIHRKGTEMVERVNKYDVYIKEGELCLIKLSH